MKSLQLLAAVVFAATLLMLASGCGRNREVRNEKGNIVPGSVTYAQKVQINGLEQTIYIRSAKASAPVVLWLDGVPGGSEVGMVNEYLPTLPMSFTVVCWDQRGTGGSAMELIKTSKVNDYVKDTIALSELLNKRYHGRIYLAGRGWGSIIGLKAVELRPDLYMGFVSVAQRVNTTETDRLAYQMVVAGTARWGDALRNNELKSNGAPPYSVSQPGAYPLLFSLIPQYSPRVYGMRIIDPRKVTNAEHSMDERSTFAQRAQLGLDYLYPQLKDLDFEQQASSVKVPCFFIVGKWDFQTPGQITERYYQKLDAPDKDLVWFDKSSNFACYQEPDRFVDYMVNTVVPRCNAVTAAATTQPAK